MDRFAAEESPVRRRRLTFSTDLFRHPQPLPRFRVELQPPDLSEWERGTDGIPGVVTRRSGKPGPHLVLVSLIHGNEFAGAIALDLLLRSGFTPPSGRISVIFANLDALARFDPANPIASRFVDEDLNRLWSRDILGGNQHSKELARARALEPVIASADLLLDLHTMLWEGSPLLLAPNLPEALDFARDSGRDTPVELLATLLNYKAGARLIEHARFVPGGGGHACLLEAGPHWSKQSLAVTDAVVQQALKGIWAQSRPNTSPIPTAFVTDKIFAESSGFSFTAAYRSGTTIARRGTVIARDGMDDILTPYDNCVLILPNYRPARGHLAVRLARMN